MNTRFVAILVAIAVLFAGLLLMNKRDADAPTNGGQPVQATNHVRGEGTSGVTLIEYGDFECPACAAYYPVLKQVKEKYGDQITFQFRHFPLIQIHQNAMAAHRAAEAAAKQDKFWEMHDLLYERQQSWKNSTNPASIFEGYAEELELDIERYKADVASSEINQIIQADLREGQALRLTSTPSFVLNGNKLEENPRDLDGFSALIDEAIKEKSTGENQ
jgi:protein-disulfide isomerase